MGTAWPFARWGRCASTGWIPENCRTLKKELAVTPEQAEQFLRGRRSIRTFKEKTVPTGDPGKTIGGSRSAPSAKNLQPWHWIVVQEPREVRRLAGLVVEAMRAVLETNPEEGKIRGYHRVVAAWDTGLDRVCREAPISSSVMPTETGFSVPRTPPWLEPARPLRHEHRVGVCWGGYLYKTVNAYPPLFEALGLPKDHLAFGAVMVGYPKFKYQRLPVRNQPRVTWK